MKRKVREMWFKKRLRDLDEIIKTQCSNGNWNYSSYMFGLANGLILSKAILTRIDAKFLSKPNKWLKEKK